LFFSGIALVIQIPLASAVDYGVGVAHEGTGNIVLIPIRLDSLIIEPEITYRRQKTANTAPGFSSDETFTQYGLGTGIYARRPLGPSFEGYFGGRVGYSRSRDHSSQEITALATFSNHQKSTSWFVGPTAGLQHYFSKQFSISLDVGLVYQYTKNDFSFDSNDQSFNTRTTVSLTRILLRGYF